MSIAMEEPGALIRWIIFVVSSGDSAYWGALIVTFAFLLRFQTDSRPPVRLFYVMSAVGLGCFLILCGSPPIPIWFQVASGILLISLFVRKRGTAQATNVPNVVNRQQRLATVVWLTTAFLIELPYQFWFAPPGTVQKLLVIGDSVTAGLNDGDDTWPRQLSRQAAVEVIDASQPGATLKSARKQNQRFSRKSGLVVLEIGGNDLLEGLPVKQFEYELDQL